MSTAHISQVIANSYLFDANAFIDVGERFYPDDIFGCLWKNISQALTNGSVVTCKGVLGELKKAPIQLPWRQKIQMACQNSAINESDADIQKVFARLAGLSISKGVGNVDRWVLSAGEARSLPIVTRDGPMFEVARRGHSFARLLTPTDFFREVGWSFP
jgi:hypothetical protein